MSTPVGVDLGAAPDPYGVIAFRGADAARYLQGQLSADTVKLAPGGSTLAGLHNPQGRVMALLALARAAETEFLAALPLELVEPVVARLRKFVLRAKVAVADESDRWRVLGTWSAADHPGFPAITLGARQLLLVPAGQEFRAPEGLDHHAWERADIVEGLPQVHAATSETFVAQMLNLDLLGAIAFDKGCYTGQEVIARAHYRGRVKRRMQRWHVPELAALKPGDAARSADGRSLTVVRVEAAGRPDRGALAVGTFLAGGEESPASGDGTVILAGPIPLPYPLPE